MSNYARRPRRMLAGILVGALALSVSPILGFHGVASADHIEVAEPIGPGNFCEDVPQTEPFTDVQPTDPSYGEIVCLVATEITTGVTATTYEPNSFVTRRQMALFLVRLANEANRLEIGDNINELPAPADTSFTDTEDEEQFIEDAISQITQAGVAEGFPDGSYRPAAPVSRRQMAAFIDRMYEFLTGAPLPNAAVDYFADDNADSAEAQESTNAVAEAGIFIGNEDGTFRPAQEITRRQMANVLTRTLQVLFENGEINQWSAEGTNNQDFAVAPNTAATLNVGQTRSFTISGLGTATAVDIALVDCAEVTNTNGTITFGDNEGNANEADDINTPNATADIATVNGVAQANNTDFVNNAPVVNGQVTFTIQGDAPGCVVAVVFADADNDNQLDLDASDQPTEAFAVTGTTTFVNITGVNATPETDINPFGSQHTVTAQLTGDPANANLSVPGRNVIFQVVRGWTTCNTGGPGGSGGVAPANTSTGGTVISTQTVPSGATGQSAITYTGPADPTAGNDPDVVDCIVVVLDADNDGIIDAGEPTDVVSKTWTDDAPVTSTLTLTPEEDTNLVGTNHTLTALVTNQFGQPIPAGQPVQFDIYRFPGAVPISSTTANTNAQGQAVLTYAGPATEADDVILACIETAGGDTICSGDDPIQDFAVKRWFSTPAAPTNTVANSCVRFADTTNDFVDVEAPANGVNNRFPYDAGDQFNVDGVAATLAQFETAVTAGDRIQVNFVPGGVSTFALINDTDCTP